jgi:outer membrane protein assembly factor BamA
MFTIRFGIPLGIILVLFLRSASPSHAQSASPERSVITDSTHALKEGTVGITRKDSSIQKDSSAKAVRDSTRADTANVQKQGGIGAPFLEYSPETGLGAGLVGIYYFHLSHDSVLVKTGRPSNLAAGFTVTTKHQFTSGLGYDLYLDSDRYHLIGGFDFKRYPFNFYGVGDHSPINPIDHYTPLWIGGDAVFAVKLLNTPVGNGLNLGTELEIRHDKILSSDSGAIIQAGNVPGAKGGLTSGAGYNLSFDDRDNVYSTHSGQYAYISAMYYGTLLGSTFNFNRYTLDLRSFTPVFTTHTLAFQGIVVVVKGVEPFYEMARLGGELNLRGYYEGRLRDNNMVLLQGEYRLPVWWRFGLVGFGDIGQVAGSVTGFKADAFRYSFGAGLRVMIIPEEHLGVRLDYGIGNDSQELYFSILEAF